MTTERSGMSLQDVYDKLRAAEKGANGPTLWPGECGDMADAIDAHLSRAAVVTEADVHRFQEVYDAEWDKAVEADPGSLKSTADHKATMAALSSFAARHADVPDEIDLTSAPSGWPNAEAACYASGWNACREAMLAQRDGG